MTLAKAVSCLPIENWVTRQVIVLDWYDGPREGIAELQPPACEFYFELLSERYNPDGVDDRLFRLWELPTGSVLRLLESFSVLGGPMNVVWSPMWKFEKEEDRAQCEHELKCVLDQRTKTDVAIWTRDFRRFDGMYHLATDRTEDDWFKALGINDK